MRVRYYLSVFICLILFSVSLQAVEPVHPSRDDRSIRLQKDNTGRIVEWIRHPAAMRKNKSHMDTETIVRSFLQQFKTQFRAARLDLKTERQLQTTNGQVIWFRQHFDGHPVFDGALYASVHNGDVLTIKDDTVVSHGWPVHPDRQDNAGDFILARHAALRAFGELEAGYFHGRPVYRVQALMKAGDPEEWMVDAESYQILNRRPLFHHDGQTGAGFVFYPNPIAYTGDTTLTDSFDEAYAALNDARVEVPLRLLDGSGFLKNQYVDLSAPGMDAGGVLAYTPGTAQEMDGNFFYDRDDFRFEEVNAYYWITELAIYIADILGHPEAVSYAVPVNVHYLRLDNSYYSELDRGLHFGDGLVDDAEDAEIVLHEFGHAVLHNLVPGLGTTWEAAALDEGTCDYLAATFSNDPFFPDTIAEWDAIGYDDPENMPARLRPIVTDRYYPDDMYEDYPRTGVPDFHWDGVIWSSTLWQIREHLGAFTMDSLLMDAFPRFYRNISFAAAADNILTSDLILYDGAHDSTVRYFFTKRGIFSDEMIHPPQPTEELTHRMIISLLLQDSEFESSVCILNTSGEECTVSVQVVGDNGCRIYEEETFLLTPGGRRSWSPVRGRLQAPCWVLLASSHPLSGYASLVSKDGLKSAFIPATNHLSDSLLVPHIAQNTTVWDTYSAIVNTTGDPVALTFAPGESTEPVDFAETAPFAQVFLEWFSTYFDGEYPDGFDGWGRVHMNGTGLAGAEIFEKKGVDIHQMAGLDFGLEPSDRLFFPHIASRTGYWWTGIVLLNLSTEPAFLTVSPFAADGSPLASVELLLAPGEKRVCLVQDLWTDQGTDFPVDTAWLRVDADQSTITGVELFGTLPDSGDRLLAGLNAATVTANTLLFPHVALTEETWAGIAFINAGDQPAVCSAKAMDDQGNVLATVVLPEIPVNGKWVSTARELFDGTLPDGCTQIQIHGDTELVGLQLWGNTVPQQDHLSGMLAFPVLLTTTDQS